MKIILYYQTLTDISPILKKNSPVTHIHLSSIHFGNDSNGYYIHLNDHSPYDKIFDEVWTNLEIAENLGIKIILMVGGAGTAYNELFLHFDIYYEILKKLIQTKKYISGIDLDIERNCRY